MYDDSHNDNDTPAGTALTVRYSMFQSCIKYSTSKYNYKYQYWVHLSTSH